MAACIGYLETRQDTLDPNAYDVILGHGPGCSDGAVAMWSIWRALDVDYRRQLEEEGGFYAASTRGWKRKTATKANSIDGAMRLQENGYSTVFAFMAPTDHVPERLVAGKRVLIIDLDVGSSLPAILRVATSVFLVDHHESTFMTLTEHREALFGTYRDKFRHHVDTSPRESAATLVWRMIHGEVPPLVEIVRIRDTWQWSDYPELQARAVSEALFQEKVFSSFGEIEWAYVHWDRKFKTWCRDGRCLVKQKLGLAAAAAAQCSIGYIQIADGTVYTVAHVQTPLLRSEIGACLRKWAQRLFSVEIDFSATWRYLPHSNMVSVSLRDPIEGLNLGAIARSIPNTCGLGGGQSNAASFSFSGMDHLTEFIAKVRPIEIARPLRASPPRVRVEVPRKKFVVRDPPVVAAERMSADAPAFSSRGLRKFVVRDAASGV